MTFANIRYDRISVCTLQRGRYIIMRYEKIRSIISFYNSFSFGSILITLICLSVIVRSGTATLTALIWFKFITLFIILYHINSYKKDDFYYYKNLGISKSNLWLGACTIDISLFVFFIFLTLKIR